MDKLGGKTISILTGDFLAPYLLSSLDKGKGMIQMLNNTPIDYVIWGNHEDDLPHKEVCKRIQEYKGIWLNTNMTTHEMMNYQKEFEIIDVHGSNFSKKIAMIGILSNSPSLYRNNAFGGAKIEDPYETMAKYKQILENEHKADLVLPLCHLYEPQDHVTCERFDFPVIISGHDHHKVDNVVNKSRLLKAGADADNAIVLDLIWDSPSAPLRMNVEFLVVPDFTPDPTLQFQVKKAYGVLDHLLRTELTEVAEKYRPLTSVASRSKAVTVASFLWSALRDELNRDHNQSNGKMVDCVLLAGGDIRGNRDYPDHCYFSLENLKSEIQEGLVGIIVEMDGKTLSDGLKCTHSSSNPGYIQFDDGVKLNEDGDVICIDNQPIELQRKYRFVTTLWDLSDGPSDPWKAYYKANPSCIVSEEGWHVFTLLLTHFAHDVWNRIFARIDKNKDGVISSDELSEIDGNQDGKIDRLELLQCLKNIGFEVDEDELTFIDNIMDVAGDANRDGFLTLDEINAKNSNSKQ